MITSRFAKAACFAAFWVLLFPVPIPAGKPEKAKDAPLLLHAYVIHNGVLTVPDPSSKTGAQKLMPGIKPVSDSDPRPDVKAWMESLGVPFPPGAEAVYQADGITRPCIVVRQTQENLDLMDTIIQPCICSVPTQVEAEISVYRLPSGGTPFTPADGKWNPDALQRLATSPFLLDRLICLTKSGQESEAIHRQGKETCSATVAPTVGPDGNTVDVQLDYRLKIAAEKPGREREIAVRTSTRLADGHSILVKSATLPAKEGDKAKGETILVVLRASIHNEAGWPLDEADKAGKP